MPIFNPLEIPDYAQAVIQERLIRDSAFLNLPENVAGFDLRPMTLRDKLVLRIANSPLLTEKETPSPNELAQFLWAMSVEYKPDKSARKRFLKRCRSFVPPARGLFHRRKCAAAMAEATRVLMAAREYVKEATMDRPGNASSGFVPDYYSEVVFWLALVEYRWTVAQVLDTPLKVLYQILNQKKESLPNSVMCNPLSDKVRAEWLASLQPK